MRTRTPARCPQVTNDEPKGSEQSDQKSDAPSQKWLSRRNRNDDVSDDVIDLIATDDSKRTRIGTKLGNSSNETTMIL